MYNRRFIIFFSVIYLMPATVFSQEFEELIQFKVTNTASPNKIENIHAACASVKNSEQLLCNFTFSSLNLHKKNNTKLNDCTVSVLPLKPIILNKKEKNIWEHTSEPERFFCGMVSKYEMVKDPAESSFFRWTITISSEETNMSSLSCQNRAAIKKSTKYTKDVILEQACESLTFSPGPF